MKIVNFEDASHSVNIIPRRTPTTALTLVLYNEATQVSTSPDVTYSINSGILTFDFDFTFLDEQKYQFSLLESTETIYIGRFFAINTEAQSYKQTNNLYFYE